MSRTAVTMVTAASLCAAFGAAALIAQPMAPVEPSENADLIFTNGKIVTPGGVVSAVAVRGGVIVATGDSASIGSRRSSGTRMIDLKGGAMLPGLHDSHVHAMTGGLDQFACGIVPGSKPEAIAASVKACAATKKPGEWIVGGSWIAAVFKPGQLTAAFLDKVSPNNPVMLTDESHHSSWVNSRALAIAGIRRDTPNPTGGIIERDAKGNPTGVLRENATDLVDQHIPPISEETKRMALLWATNKMLSYGITSFTDAGITKENVGTFSKLAAEGLLKQRVRGCMRWVPGTAQTIAESEQLIANRARWSRGNFTLDCVKLVLDGVPTDSRTAAMLAPYVHSDAGHGDNSRAKGLVMIPQTVLDKATAGFDRQGLLIKFHTAGDAAVRSAIDAVAQARKVNGRGGPSHDVGHDNFVDPADLPRVRDLNMTLEFSPYVWYPTPVADQDVRKVIGDERMKRWTPIKDGLDSGALVVAGSDWSVVPSVNPWLAIETMVTRQLPGGSKASLGEGQRVSLDEALRIFTVNGAMHQGHRNLVGSIEPGMLADLVVVDRSPYDVPVTEVHATKVRMTFVGGELVYDAANPPVGE